MVFIIYTFKSQSFRKFAELFEKHKKFIINSFIIVETQPKKKNNLSNRSTYSLNSKIKDLKRRGRESRNFEYFKNRMLYVM
ncbi:MAG: transposase [Clostridia bacterium]|nr:transposase [Clostridia bacterium]